MKKSALVVIFALLLFGTTFMALPIKGYAGQIKIGIIGPHNLPHWSPAGMKEAAEMARDEINGAGGVNINGSYYEIVLVFKDEHALPLDPAAGAAEMRELCDPLEEDCDYVIGGFRSECVAPMIEVAADYGKPFIINGASTSSLIADTIGTDYNRYKYLYRLNPVNSTTLFYTIAGSLQYYLIPVKLLPLYGHDLGMGYPQVRVAVLTEDLEWTLEIHGALTHPAIYPSVLGPYANVTYAGRIPDGTTDCTPWLGDVISSGARLLIHVFSGTSGVPLIGQWGALGVQALPVGINVLAQLEDHWTTTGGLCEYETILNFAGTRTPIVPGVTEVFWDNFVAKTGKWPLYTGWGAYDAIHGLAEAMEDIGSHQATVDKDDLLAYFEDPSYERTGLNGKFKYTSLHDVYSNEPGPVWTQGYVRALCVQWLSERMEVVCPVDKLYSKRWAIPPAMYPLQTDLTYDGKVDIKDIALAAKSFGSYPGHPKWDKEADINYDSKVDIKDIARIAKDFGEVITLPLP
jgi:branched-chain amino acid transport system substrate-binding protein